MLPYLRMKPTSLRGRKNCERVLRKGKVWKGNTMIARILPGRPTSARSTTSQAIYLGTYASAKLDKSAVRRNRMRRRIREAVRLSLLEKTPWTTAQLLITPRSASLDAPFDVLRSDAESLLSVLPVWHPHDRTGHAS